MLTFYSLYPATPLKQSAPSVKQWSIKKPLIIALYSLLLDVNFNLQSPIQFPFSRVAGSIPNGQDNERRGRKSPQAEREGCGGWRGSLGILFFFFSLFYLYLHRELDCPDGGDFHLYWRRQWHFPAVCKKEKKKKEEEENCWLIMSGPRGDNYLHIIHRGCNSEDIKRS